MGPRRRAQLKHIQHIEAGCNALLQQYNNDKKAGGVLRQNLWSNIKELRKEVRVIDDHTERQRLLAQVDSVAAIITD